MDRGQHSCESSGANTARVPLNRGFYGRAPAPATLCRRLELNWSALPRRVTLSASVEHAMRSEPSSCISPDLPSDDPALAVPPSTPHPKSVYAQLYRLPKSTLRDGLGRAYPEFKRGLLPRYAIVWRDIALGHLALVALLAGLYLVQRLAPTWVTLLCLPVGALLLGFTLAFLNLFFH